MKSVMSWLRPREKEKVSLPSEYWQNSYHAVRSMEAIENILYFLDVSDCDDWTFVTRHKFVERMLDVHEYM
jgi:hypothetical protein